MGVTDLSWEQNRQVDVKSEYQSFVQDKAEVEHELENAHLQLVWNKEMQKGCSLNGYRKVAVMLIEWDPTGDEVGTNDKVDGLRDVFQDMYNFHVTRVQLSQWQQKSSQLQLMDRLNQWLWDQDSSNTLLLVYYAGHEIPGFAPGRLQIAGPTAKLNDSDAIVWDHGKDLHTQADVLKIFDCCFAETSANQRDVSGFSSRNYEFVAVCGVKPSTKPSGVDSFTKALTCALKEMAGLGGFTTAELLRRIRDSQNFPRDDYSILLGQDPASIGRIVLAPLPPRDTERIGLQAPEFYEKKDATKSHFEHLELRLVLEKHPTADQIASFAKDLFSVLEKCKSSGGLSVNRVIWGGLHSSKLSSITSYKLLAEPAEKAELLSETDRIIVKDAAWKWLRIAKDGQKSRLMRDELHRSSDPWEPVLRLVRTPKDFQKADTDRIVKQAAMKWLRIAKNGRKSRGMEILGKRIEAKITSESIFFSVTNEFLTIRFTFDYKCLVSKLLAFYTYICKGIGRSIELSLRTFFRLVVWTVSCGLQISIALTRSLLLNALLGLQPRIHPGHVRVPWTCCCGMSSYDDFLEHRTGSAARLMKDLEIQSRPNSVLPIHESRQNTVTTALSSGPSFRRFRGSDVQPSLNQGNDQNQWPGTVPGNSSDVLLEDPHNGKRYVLACINGSYSQPEMFHLDWKTGANDKAMFKQLQCQYHVVRGRWRRWLSLWTLQSVLFIQFEAFPHHLINVGKEHDLPPEDPYHKKVYEFTPRPTDICPPLGPNFLKHRIQYPEHAGDISRCCEQFPKKLLGNVVIGEVAWGLRLNEGLDKTRLVVVIVTVFISSSVTGIVFSKVTGNLQSGLAVASYMMAGLAVVVSSAQLAIEHLTKS